MSPLLSRTINNHARFFFPLFFSIKKKKNCKVRRNKVAKEKRGIGYPQKEREYIYTLYKEKRKKIDTKLPHPNRSTNQPNKTKQPNPTHPKGVVKMIDTADEKEKEIKNKKPNPGPNPTHTQDTNKQIIKKNRSITEMRGRDTTPRATKNVHGKKKGGQNTVDIYVQCIKTKKRGKKKLLVCVEGIFEWQSI